MPNDSDRKKAFGGWNYEVALNSPDKDQAARGALILNRLVPAPDHGRGFRRDPETGFVYYSSEWLNDDEFGHYSTPRDGTTSRAEYWRKRLDAENDAKAPE